MSENLRDKIEAAWREVERLCDGGRWQMTVPVDQRRDSDIIIGDALKAASDALAERDVLRAALAKVDAVRSEMLGLQASGASLVSRQWVIYRLDAALASVPAVDAGDREPASEVCSTCGQSFDAPPCCISPQTKASGHTRVGGVGAASEVQP